LAWNALLTSDPSRVVSARIHTDHDRSSILMARKRTRAVRVAVAALRFKPNPELEEGLLQDGFGAQVPRGSPALFCKHVGLGSYNQVP
jgi:hypothetical protein